MENVRKWHSANICVWIFHNSCTLWQCHKITTYKQIMSSIGTDTNLEKKQQDHAHRTQTKIPDSVTETYATIHNRFTALSPGPPGWAGARRELLDFMVQGKSNRDRHIYHPAGHHSIRTNERPPPPSPIFFYRPDALPATQPTLSKHWRQYVIRHNINDKSYCLYTYSVKSKLQSFLHMLYPETIAQLSLCTHILWLTPGMSNAA